MLTIAVCDDERNVCDYMEKRCRDYLAAADMNAEISAFYDGNDLVKSCAADRDAFDIIFLDIKMKNSNGVDCAKELRDSGVQSLIVFVTSSAEYVFSGYEVKAFRYILKTDLVNAFDRIFAECIKELSADNDGVFTVKTAASVKTVKLADILYFESDRRKLIIHTKNETAEFYGKLDEVEKELAQKEFIRTHQSFLVNAVKISEVRKNDVRLENGEVLPVSKSKSDKVKEAFLWAQR